METDQASTASRIKPAAMLHSPKKRIWPLPSVRICSNMRRQPPGEMKGNKPSMTSIRASASQKVLPSTPAYFLAGAVLPVPGPRIALKKSEDGSSTITSLFLLKLAL